MKRVASNSRGSCGGCFSCAVYTAWTCKICELATLESHGPRREVSQMRWAHVMRNPRGSSTTRETTPCIRSATRQSYASIIIPCGCPHVASLAALGACRTAATRNKQRATINGHQFDLKRVDNSSMETPVLENYRVGKSVFFFSVPQV